MGRYRKLAAVAAGLLAGPVLMAGAAQAAPDSGEGKAWNPTLLSSEPLYDGSAVRLRYTEGVTVVATAGAKVSFTGSEAPTTTADGRRVYDRAVRVTEPVQRASAAAEKYAAAGRSVYSDALAAGFSEAEARGQAHQQGDYNTMYDPSKPIKSSACVASEDNNPDPDYEWEGCYTLYDLIQYDDQGYWYAPASGTAHGWGTGVLSGGKELQKGYSLIGWHDGADPNGVKIIEASPPSNTLSGEPCAAFTITLSQVFGIEYQVPLCDDGWAVTWQDDLHNVEWYGASTGGNDDTRHASGSNTVKVPPTSPQVWIFYEIGWTVACFC